MLSHVSVWLICRAASKKGEKTSSGCQRKFRALLICIVSWNSCPNTIQTIEALLMCFQEHTLQERFVWHCDRFFPLFSSSINLDDSQVRGVTVQKALRYEDCV